MIYNWRHLIALEDSNSSFGKISITLLKFFSIILSLIHQDAGYYFLILNLLH